MDTPFCIQLCLMLCVCEASFIVHDAIVIRKANITRDREAALKRLNGYTENEFKRRFRMLRYQFDLLVNSIRETLEPQTYWAKQCAINSSGSWVAAELKVAATLRVLSGGSYLDAADLFAVSEKSFHRNTFWPVVIAICNCKLPCLVMHYFVSLTCIIIIDNLLFSIAGQYLLSDFRRVKTEATRGNLC